MNELAHAVQDLGLQITGSALQERMDKEALLVAEGIERVITLSTHKDMKFADDYGVHDTDWRVCQRAVFVVDADNVVRHVEYVPVIGSEPDYIAALSAAQKLV